MAKEFEPENIIVRMPNWIGDLVMATPVLYDLKRAYPKAKITAMCSATLVDLLQGNSSIDSILPFKKKSLALEKKNYLEKLKRGKYDLGILLTNSFSSAWLFWLGRVKNRLGYASDARALFLTYDIAFPENVGRQHLVKTYKHLLSPLGITPSETPPQLFVREEEKENGRLFLKRYGVSEGSMLIGINPGAAYGTAKCWLPERFKEVTKRLAKKENLTILYFGDSSSLFLVEEICRDLSSNVINLAGKTSLRELITLISLCKVLLTNDSGPMHIADALGTPLVALFGSTNDLITGPYSGGKVIHKHVKCSPCYQRICPIDFPCMKQIGVHEVFQEIETLLNKNLSKLHTYA